MMQEKNKTEKMLTEKEDYELLGGKWEDASDENGFEDEKREIQNLEHYRYFDGSRIFRSVSASQKVVQAGERLYKQGKVALKTVWSGYDNTSLERRGQLEAIGKQDGREFGIRIIFSRKDIQYFQCGCNKCRTNYFYQYHTDRTDCPYKIGALMLLKEHLENHNIGDATDLKGLTLLNAF